MAAFSGPTSCAVAITRRLGGLSSKSNVVARVGEELFLDEELRGLSGGGVTSRGRIVGTILLVLQV